LHDRPHMLARAMLAHMDTMATPAASELACSTSTGQLVLVAIWAWQGFGQIDFQIQ